MHRVFVSTHFKPHLPSGLHTNPGSHRSAKFWGKVKLKRESVVSSGATPFSVGQVKGWAAILIRRNEPKTCVYPESLSVYEWLIKFAFELL